MRLKRRKHPAGLTFIEILIATVVLLIAVLGTSAYRYSTALNARRADLQATAARTALLLCESWRGAGDPNTFDPTLLSSADPTTGVTIEAVNLSLEALEGFTVLGTYRVTADGTDYHALLSYKDIFPELKALNVVVAWNQRGSASDYHMLPDKTFSLTTYAD